MRCTGPKKKRYLYIPKWPRMEPMRAMAHRDTWLAASIPPANPMGRPSMPLPCQAMSPPSRGPLYCWHGPSAVRANLPWPFLKNVLSRPALALARCPPARLCGVCRLTLRRLLAFWLLLPISSPAPHPFDHIPFSLQADLINSIPSPDLSRFSASTFDFSLQHFNST